MEEQINTRIVDMCGCEDLVEDKGLQITPLFADTWSSFTFYVTRHSNTRGLRLLTHFHYLLTINSDKFKIYNFETQMFTEQ